MIATEDDTLTIPASELQRGDVIHTPRERGGQVSGTKTAQRVVKAGDTVTVTVASGVYDVDIPYRAGELVTVWRD